MGATRDTGAHGLTVDDIAAMCAAMPYTLAMFERADGATVRLLGWFAGETPFAVSIGGGNPTPYQTLTEASQNFIDLCGN